MAEGGGRSCYFKENFVNDIRELVNTHSKKIVFNEIKKYLEERGFDEGDELMKEYNLNGEFEIIEFLGKLSYDLLVDDGEEDKVVSRDFNKECYQNCMVLLGFRKNSNNHWCLVNRPSPVALISFILIHSVQKNKSKNCSSELLLPRGSIWKCHMCDLDNTPNSDICETCREPKLKENIEEIRIGDNDNISELLEDELRLCSKCGVSRIDYNKDGTVCRDCLKKMNEGKKENEKHNYNNENPEKMIVDQNIIDNGAIKNAMEVDQEHVEEQVGKLKILEGEIWKCEACSFNNEKENINCSCCGNNKEKELKLCSMCGVSRIDYNKDGTVCRNCLKKIEQENELKLCSKCGVSRIDYNKDGTVCRNCLKKIEQENELKLCRKCGVSRIDYKKDGTVCRDCLKKIEQEDELKLCSKCGVSRIDYNKDGTVCRDCLIKESALNTTKEVGKMTINVVNEWVCEFCSFKNSFENINCECCENNRNIVKMCSKCRKIRIDYNKDGTVCRDCLENIKYEKKNYENLENVDSNWEKLGNKDIIAATSCSTCNNKVLRGSDGNFCIKCLYESKKCFKCCTGLYFGGKFCLKCGAIYGTCENKMCCAVKKIYQSCSFCKNKDSNKCGKCANPVAMGIKGSKCEDCLKNKAKCRHCRTHKLNRSKTLCSNCEREFYECNNKSCRAVIPHEDLKCYLCGLVRGIMCDNDKCRHVNDFEYDGQCVKCKKWRKSCVRCSKQIESGNNNNLCIECLKKEGICCRCNCKFYVPGHLCMKCSWNHYVCANERCRAVNERKNKQCQLCNNDLIEQTCRRCGVKYCTTDELCEVCCVEYFVCSNCGKFHEKKLNHCQNCSNIIYDLRT